MPLPPQDRRTFLTRAVGAFGATMLLPDAPDLFPVVQGPALRVAVIGAGRQGRAIVAELQKIPQVQIAAVCDTSAARVEAARGRTPDAAGFTDHRALLAAHPDITAVVVATPTHRHRDVVIDALAAGRHVYCEAPIASTVEDCRAIVAASEAAAAAGTGAPRVVQAGFQGRSNPTYRRAQPLVRTELRTLVSLFAQSHRKTSWRFPATSEVPDRDANWRLDPDVSTGLAGELGSQQMDVAHWCRGVFPVRALGRGAIRLHDDGRRVADTVEVDLLYEDGVAMRWEATLASSYGGQFEIIRGVNATIRLAWTHGWLFKEVDAPTQGWEVYATRQQVADDEGIVLIANATQLAAQGQLQSGVGLPHPSLYYALVDFVRSINEGTPVACPIADGAKTTIVSILANQAVVSGKAVDITV